RADGGSGARVPAGHRRARGERRAGPRREPRRALSRGPPAARRRPLDEALAVVPSGRRLDQARVQGRETGTVRPDGAEVLMSSSDTGAGVSPEHRGAAPELGDVLDGSAEAEWNEGPPREPGAKRVGGSEVTGKVSLTIRIKRFNPEVREDPWW